MYDTYPKNETAVRVRWIIRRDYPEVLCIEEKGSEFPWTEDDFIRCLRQRNAIGMVAETKEEVVGFMIYELYKTTIHLVNFAVHPDWRRQKIGTQMVKTLVGKLSPQKRKRITVEIRETHLPAQLFFRQCGFRVISIFRKHYDDTSEDAYLMLYKYQDPQEKQNIKKEDLLTRVISGLRDLNNP